MTGKPTSASPNEWPPAPADRRVVLHTRVVTGVGGGPEKTILLSAPHLADSDYWLAAAYMHPPGDPGFATLRRRAAELESPLISVADRGALDWRVVRELVRLCKHYRVAIWHGHDYKSNFLGLVVRKFWSMKLVSTVHGWVKQTRRTPLYYAIDRHSLKRYDHVICVSEDLHDRVVECGALQERVSTVRNAIDAEVFRRQHASTEAALRRHHNVPPGRLVLGAVGRLSPEKGFMSLIRATARVVRGGHDVELWIAGEGDERDVLARLIDELGLHGRVRLLGFCNDVLALYEALDVFVLSSGREGLPNVVLEALAMRVPLVSTRVAGIPHLLEDRVHGILCDTDHLDGLTRAITEIVTAPELRGRLAEAGRQLVESSLSFRERMRKVEAIYDTVLGG